MKKKVRFNLLDAAILLVAVGLVLSFVFRAELARIVSGAEEAAYTVTFTVVTTPENADALAVGARLTDGDGNVFAGEVTALSPAEGFGALAGQRALSVPGRYARLHQGRRRFPRRRHAFGAGRFVRRHGGRPGAVHSDWFRRQKIAFCTKRLV